MTPRQFRFVAEYMRDCNATRAAQRAGYSFKNADKIGPRLTHQPKIAAAIQVELEEAARRRQEARNAERQPDYDRRRVERLIPTKEVL
jgi:phage terminase small subunit